MSNLQPETADEFFARLESALAAVAGTAAEIAAIVEARLAAPAPVEPGPAAEAGALAAALADCQRLDAALGHAKLKRLAGRADAGRYAV